jgi:hypothetical protein
MDNQGNPCAKAVAYEVYHQQDGGLERLVATVRDTTYVLRAEMGVRHRIRVRGVDSHGRQGEWSESSDELYFEPPQAGALVPQAPQLRPNIPNPFNPQTRIVYGVPEGVGTWATLTLEIFDLNGRRVKILEPQRRPGWHSILWDGTDDGGRAQPTGQYITRLVCGDLVETWKMTMVK